MSQPMLGFLALLATGCGGSPPPACTPEARQAALSLEQAAAAQVIASGACDHYQRIEQCPDYALVEAHLYAVQKAMCAQ
jgi:hypothetical protein